MAKAHEWFDENFDGAGELEPVAQLVVIDCEAGSEDRSLRDCAEMVRLALEYCRQNPGNVERLIFIGRSLITHQETPTSAEDSIDYLLRDVQLPPTYHVAREDAKAGISCALDYEYILPDESLGVITFGEDQAARVAYDLHESGVDDAEVLEVVGPERSRWQLMNTIAPGCVALFPQPEDFYDDYAQAMSLEDLEDSYLSLDDVEAIEGFLADGSDEPY